MLFSNFKFVIDFLINHGMFNTLFISYFLILCIFFQGCQQVIGKLLKDLIQRKGGDLDKHKDTLKCFYNGVYQNIFPQDVI